MYSPVSVLKKLFDFDETVCEYNASIILFISCSQEQQHKRCMNL